MTDKDAHSPGDSLRGYLFSQPGLTDARLASDRSQPTAAGNSAVGKPAQKVTFRLSAYKGGALPGLVLHDLLIIPPAVTDRLRATRKRSSGPGRLILTLQRIGTYPPSLPSRPARLRCRSRHGRGSTARGAQGMGQWAPPHHPVRPRPHQAQPGSPLPGRPRCATAAVPARVRQPDPRCPGSHSGPRPSDGTRSATRSVVASAPMTET